MSSQGVFHHVEIMILKIESFLFGRILTLYTTEIMVKKYFFESKHDWNVFQHRAYSYSKCVLCSQIFDLLTSESLFLLFGFRNSTNLTFIPSNLDVQMWGFRSTVCSFHQTETELIESVQLKNMSKFIKAFWNCKYWQKDNVGQVGLQMKILGLAESCLVICTAQMW